MSQEPYKLNTLFQVPPRAASFELSSLPLLDEASKAASSLSACVIDALLASSAGDSVTGCLDSHRCGSRSGRGILISECTAAAACQCCVAHPVPRIRFAVVEA